MCDLSNNLRDYNATNNATGAHAMMSAAADKIDVLVSALQIANHETLTSGARAVIEEALMTVGATMESAQ